MRIWAPTLPFYAEASLGLTRTSNASEERQSDAEGAEQLSDFRPLLN